MIPQQQDASWLLRKISARLWEVSTGLKTRGHKQTAHKGVELLRCYLSTMLILKRGAPLMTSTKTTKTQRSRLIIVLVVSRRPWQGPSMHHISLTRTSNKSMDWCYFWLKKIANLNPFSVRAGWGVQRWSKPGDRQWSTAALLFGLTAQTDCTSLY